MIKLSPFRSTCLWIVILKHLGCAQVKFREIALPFGFSIGGPVRHQGLLRVRPIVGWQVYDAITRAWHAQPHFCAPRRCHPYTSANDALRLQILRALSRHRPSSSIHTRRGGKRLVSLLHQLMASVSDALSSVRRRVRCSPASLSRSRRAALETSPKGAPFEGAIRAPFDLISEAKH